MNSKIFSWIAQLIVVVIIGQTLFYKFTDHPDTVTLFQQLGMGAFGYKLIGSLELVACILLLIPGTVAWGSLLAWGLMSGAIIAHTTEIGFAGANGILGGMAIVSWLLCVTVLYIRRCELPLVGYVFRKSKSELHS